MTSSGETSPTTGTPLTPGQPKYGTLIPNRIFVGGIPANTQENELKMFFSNLGAVKDCKIINDRAGVSKGSYGFVTFETQEDADKVIKKEAENLIFKERKLNIGPAIRKQLPRMEPAPGVYFTNSSLTPYSYQNGMAVFHEYPLAAAQPQPAAAYPVMAAAAQQAMYAVPQGYATVQTSPPAATPASWTTATAANQFRWTPQSPGSAVGPYMYTPLQTAEMVAYTQPAAAHMYATDISDVEATTAAAAAEYGFGTQYGAPSVC